MAKLFADSGDPDQTPSSAASDLGLHCLPSTLLRVSRLQWVKGNEFTSRDNCQYCFTSLLRRSPLLKEGICSLGELGANSFLLE